MKKLLSLLFVFLMLVSFTACDEAADLLQDAADLASNLDDLQSEAGELADKADDLLSGESVQASEEIPSEEGTADESEAIITEELLDPSGTYTSKEDVSLYLHLYGELPGNFITKSEARDLGWEGGSLEPYAPGMCIGGDHFGNYEELLPTDRTYHECDIDTLGASSRGAKRLVFSEDGLIYYTEDHYESFELLYGEP